MCQRLPERQKRAILLRYGHDLSISEIAEVEGAPEGTIKSRIHYAKKRLGREWQDTESE